MRKNQLSEIELLAPAGNMASALAAFDAGADAVYCGLKQFNARERSENFTVREMAKLIEYAHRNGKRVHVTFNTLVRESELLSAAESLAVLTDLRPDAVIVQDIGIVSVIRDFFPDLVIHASTQMGIHNSAGLESACAMGVKRVILERQVTLGEISAMTGNGTRLPLELEVFVHGALCCCLSGSCLFSSWPTPRPHVFRSDCMRARGVCQGGRRLIRPPAAILRGETVREAHPWSSSFCAPSS